MPTVLRVNGFAIMIYANDHTDRAHVHCVKAGKVVVINLPTPTLAMVVREAQGMRQADVTAAFRIVAEHHETLTASWKAIHGDKGTQ